MTHRKFLLIADTLILLEVASFFLFSRVVAEERSPKKLRLAPVRYARGFPCPAQAAKTTAAAKTGQPSNKTLMVKKSPPKEKKWFRRRWFRRRENRENL